MNKVFAVVTSTRADYGLLVPMLRALSRADGIDYRLIVTGTHLSEQHGLTKNQIYEDDFVVTDEVPCLADRGEEPATAVTASRALYRMAGVFSRIQPDAVILPGDRYEIMASAIAASLCRIPIVHLHGGEVTEGSYDEGFRHAISKLSHIHLTAAEEYRQRVIQMGEDPDRTFVVGSPGVENLLGIKPMSRSELSENLGMELADPLLLVTLHPETLRPGMADPHSQILIEGLSKRPETMIVFTAANADAEGKVINQRFKEYCRMRENAYFIPSLGNRRYASILRIARAVVGNSSSGIIEVPSFGIPTVNVGDRQKGRLRAPSIIDVDWNAERIAQAIGTALAGAPRGQENPYGEGNASSRILEILQSVKFDRELLRKTFWDLKTT